MDVDLKPCPFCGGDNIMTLPRTCNKSTPYNPADRAFPVVRCNGCGAEVAGDNWGEPPSAITAWNRRAQALAAPEGWKLVPVEPTPEMLSEMHSVIPSTGYRNGLLPAMYRAALDAAVPQEPRDA